MKFRSTSARFSAFTGPSRGALGLAATGLLAVAATAPEAFAFDYTWNASGGNGWTTVSSWTTDDDTPTFPAALDHVIFNTASNTGGIHAVFLGDADRTAASLTFAGATPYDLKLYDSDLTTLRTLMVGGITVSAGSHTISGSATASLGLLNGSAVSVASGETLTINTKMLTSSGSANYSKTGAGTMVLGANNGGTGSWNFSTATTGFTVSEGTLKLASTGAAGNSGNKYVVADGATMELAASYGSSTLTINGTGMGGTGALFASATATISGTNPVALGSASSIGVANTKTLTVSKPITGAHSLTKSGAGGLTLSALSTYSGDTIVTAGTLSLSVANALPDATVVRIPASGATLALNFTGGDLVDGFHINGVQQESGSWGSLTSAATHKTALITGTGLINVTNASSGGTKYTWDSSDGSGDWATAANWTTDDPTPTLPEGSDNVLFNTSANSGGIYTVFLGAADRSALGLTFDGENPYDLKLYESDGITLRTLTLNSGGITVKSGSHTITGDTTVNTVGTLKLASGTLFVANGATLTFHTRIISDSSIANYAKTGTGTLVLAASIGGSSAWNFSGVGGGFSITEGTLKLAAANATALSTNKFAVAAGATMELAAAGANSYGSANLTINGTGLNGVGALYAQENTWVTLRAGELIVLGSPSSIGVADSKALTINSPITGANPLTKSGTGKLTLTALNTYSGDTTVSEGILSLSTLDSLANGAAIRLAASGATLNLTFAGQDVVDSLYIGGVQQPSGTWAATGTTGVDHTSDLITGTGILNVTNGVIIGNFTSWASANGVTGGVHGDSDNDGISNLIEYALALNFAGSDGAAGTLEGSTLTFNKRAEAVANGDITYVIEKSTDLGFSDPWTAVTPTTNTPLKISYAIPDGLPENFARFSTTVTP